ncbi:DUF1810 domain-containing protein [Falsiroseomonas sp. E2-1-a20]|uniref:DUF1810 domain-containing protein n=1 Tax=Falsiroseomonas sp. E2-1-a20 TaxID=3239300 RepID=UPI003F2B0089
MTDRFQLDRFVQAQDLVIAVVRRELREGRKRSHWMWFVFPQLRALGHSATAQHYGIASLAEAQAFMAHPVLGPRLVACAELVLAIEGRSATEIFGSPDDLKLRSSMTLFAAARPEASVFAEVLRRYFDGAPDPRTTELLAAG